MADYMITVPRKLIGAFLDELETAEVEPSLNKRFRISPNMTRPDTGDTLYVVYDGAVRGKMPILENVIITEPWECSTTGSPWAAGRYLVCNISLYAAIMDGTKIKGFQGLRRY